MAVNLVSMSSQYVTSDLTDRIANTLGADRKGVGQATSAAIPAILGSLASLASDRDGARKIDAVVSQSSPGMIDNLASSLGAGGGRSIVDRGMSSLSALFGNSSVSALGNAVGSFSGLGRSKGSSLLGILAPMVLGLLSKQKAEANLDASGIARLLGDQKDNIASAMPPDFKRMLQGAGLTNIAGVGTRRAEEAGVQAPRVDTGARAATSRPPEAAHRTESGRTEHRRTGTNWLLWLLPLLAILALAVWFFTRDGGVTTETVRQPAVTGEAQPGAVDIDSTLNNVTTALGGIDDEQSARAALPRLTEARTELDRLVETSGQLPAERRQALNRSAANAWPEVDRLSRQALAAPGVEAVAGSEITAIRNRVAALGQEQ